MVYGKKSPGAKINKNHIPLKNGVGYTKRREERCILRYYLNYDNVEDFKRGLLILFFPFQNETEEIHEKDINRLYTDNEASILAKREIFEKHKVMTDIIETIERQVEDKNLDDQEEEEDDGFREEESRTAEE